MQQMTTTGVARVRTPSGKGPSGRRAKSIKAASNYEYNQRPRRNPRHRPA